MRATIFGCVVILLTVLHVPAIAAEPAGIRDPEKLIFEGVKKVSVRDIRLALRDDFDVVLAAHPNAPLAGYLRAIEASALLGYQHSGFRDAKVAAEFDEPQERIVVRVEEGPRHYCGDVNIAGIKEADQTALIEALAQPPKNAATPWANDRPAPFDDSTRHEIRKRLNNAFAAQGFFSPRFEIQISAEPNQRQAALEIAIDSEGPRAEIGHVTFSGNERDADQDVLDYLILKPGQPYNSNLAERLKSRLMESGRFLAATIDRASPVRVFDAGREIVDLNIELRDYDDAPPLANDFSAEQKALLKLRDWLLDWSRGETDYDLAFEGSFSAAAMAQICSEMDMPMPPIQDAGIKRCDLQAVIAPHRGLLLAVRLFDGQQKVVFDQIVVIHSDHLLIVSPQRRAALKWPYLGGNQMKLNLELSPNEKPDEKGRLFSFKAGFSCTTNPRASGPALPVDADFNVAAMLSFLNADDAKCIREGEFWRLEHETLAGRLDAATGRLVELEGTSSSDDEEDGNARRSSISIRTEKSAWQRQITKIDDQLAAANLAEASAPCKPLVAFALDEAIFFMRRQGLPTETIAALEAGRKILTRWSPPAITDLWPTQKASDSQFKLPHNHSALEWSSVTSPSSRSQKNAIVLALAAYRQIVPPDSWLWTVGRDGALAMASRSSAVIYSLDQAAKLADIGPIGELLIATAGVERPRETAVRRGLQLLTIDAFRRDYQPLLSGDGWLSQWILSLAEAARSLDEAELRALPSLLDEGFVRELAANWLIILKEEPEQPAAIAVARMLDAVWAAGLRNQVAAKLSKLAPPPKVFDQPKLAFPAPGESSSADKLDALERLAAKLKKESDSKPEKPAQGEKKPGNKPISEDFTIPKTDRGNAAKDWFEQPSGPRKPLSPFPVP